jgi:hypothetical protein
VWDFWCVAVALFLSCCSGQWGLNCCSARWWSFCISLPADLFGFEALFVMSAIADVLSIMKWS